MTVLANAHVVTMDDAGTELAGGWILIEDGLIAEVGSGPPPEMGEDLAGAVVTPALINTHHHLFQTLTRARAQEADLFTWLKELYPVWARLDAEAEYAAARTVLALLGYPLAPDRIGGVGPPPRATAPHPPRRDCRGGGLLPRGLRLPAGRISGATGLACTRRLVRALRPLGRA